MRSYIFTESERQILAKKLRDEEMTPYEKKRYVQLEIRIKLWVQNLTRDWNLINFIWKDVIIPKHKESGKPLVLYTVKDSDGKVTEHGVNIVSDHRSF